MVTEREIWHGLTGFLAGMFFTLVVIGFQILEKSWLRGLVLLGLAALIGTVVWWMRKASDDDAEPSQETDKVPSASAVAYVVPAKAPAHPVVPAPKPPQPPQAEEKIYPPPVVMALSYEETGPGDPDTPEDQALEPSQAATSLNPFPEKLTEVWADYLSRGDGRFTADGLRQFLSDAGLRGEIFTGETLGAGDGLLAVDLGDGSGSLYLLPDFSKTVRSVAQWFHAPHADSRLARINRLVEPAVVRRTAEGLELKRQGVVE